MTSYETIRQRYRPQKISWLFIAESPPPEAEIQSSRHFYRSDRIRKDDRLFVNTIKALYPEAAEQTEAEIEAAKHDWLQRFQTSGCYMIEALDETQPHEITKPERQQRIAKNLPNLLRKVASLVTKQTKIILIKSNVFIVAAQPLRQAGFNVVNKTLVDYPGHFNQAAYRQKLNQFVGKPL